MDSYNVQTARGVPWSAEHTDATRPYQFFVRENSLVVLQVVMVLWTADATVGNRHVVVEVRTPPPESSLMYIVGMGAGIEQGASTAWLWQYGAGCVLVGSDASKNQDGFVQGHLPTGVMLWPGCSIEVYDGADISAGDTGTMTLTGYWHPMNFEADLGLPSSMPPYTP